MISSRTVAATLGRSLVRRNPTRVSTQIPWQCQRNYSLSRPRATISRFPIQQRAFSISVPRRFADVDDNFDPKSIEREGDEVDVCIVGGGKLIGEMSHDRF